MPSAHRHRRHRPLSAAAGALAILALGVSAAPGAEPGGTLQASAVPAQLTIGAGTTAVTGRLAVGGTGVAGAPLALQIEGYPFSGYETVARQSSGADGSFSFAGLKPDRNTRMRVVLESEPATASAPILVTVDPRVAISARSLGPGRTRLSIRITHTVHAGSSAADVLWFVAARGSRTFSLAAVTPAREIAPGVTYASATIDPPSRRFLYRACLNPGWEHAMGSRPEHGRCPRSSYTVGRDVG